MKQRRLLIGAAAWITAVVLFMVSGGLSGDAGHTPTVAREDLTQNHVKEPRSQEGGASSHMVSSPIAQRPVAVVRKPSSPARAASGCGQFTSCSSCLFESNSARREGCVWCADQKSCLSTSEKCLDAEDYACPAILNRRVPQHFRVIYVGIRKGGPEALVQLHLGLHHWGFHTTLDTRKSKKQKGGPILDFFKTKYAKEFEGAESPRWFKDYDDWLNAASEGDVMIATETWACRNDVMAFLPKGARQMQWHLTVWPRRDRSGCTIAGHTHYVAATYMRQSHHALIFPYVSPHIVELAASKPEGAWRKMKEDLVLYDSDTKLKDSDLISPGTKHKSLIATGYTPDQLYALYQKAKVGIDLQLPGGERFLYEAILFDVCVIVDNALNGIDDRDFPIPERFKVPEKNLTALNAAKAECLNNYANVIDEFKPLKEHALAQREKFLRHVRRYYSNSVHIVTAVCSESDAKRLLVDFVLSALLQVPFASVEIVIPADVWRTVSSALSSKWKVLRENSFLAGVRVTTDASVVRDACFAGGSTPTPGAAFGVAKTWTNEKRTAYTMWLQMGAVMTHELLVSVASTLISGNINNNGDAKKDCVDGDHFVICDSRVSLTSPERAQDTSADENPSARFRAAQPHLSVQHLKDTALASPPSTAGDSQHTVELASLADDHAVRAYLCTHQLWRELGSGGSKCRH